MLLPLPPSCSSLTDPPLTTLAAFTGLSPSSKMCGTPVSISAAHTYAAVFPVFTVVQTSRGPPWLASSRIRRASVRRCVHFPSPTCDTTSTSIIITITIAIIAIIAIIIEGCPAMRPVDRKRRPFAFRVSKGAPGQKTHSSRQLAGLSRPSRCFEAQLWRLLQRAPPATRKQLLQRFSEGQRLALERWVLTRKPTLLDPGGCSKARLCGQPRPRRGPAPVVAVAGAGAPYVCSHRSHGGPVRYDARISCWPFLLFTKMTLHLPTALNQLEVLGAVQRRWQRDMCQKQDFASCEVRELSFKRFNDAVALEFEAREMDLTLDSAFRFQAFVPANFLLGRRLGTPHFVVSEAGLRKGYEAWQSLYCSIHSAYALDHDNFCGRRNRFTSIANTYSAERLQEAWRSRKRFSGLRVSEDFRVKTPLSESYANLKKSPKP